MLHASFKHSFSIAALFIFMASAGVEAEEFRGSVVKASGGVYLVDARGERHTVDEAGVAVREMDTIVTAEGGRAVLRFTDGALSVIDQSSRLHIGKAGWLSQLGGRIYFTFKKVFGEPRQVKTRFATLGIRGTTFIVYDDDSGQGVALAEGLLDIETPGPAFEIHRQQQRDEFDAFKQQSLQQQQATQREFDDYRRKLEHEFVEYKENFRLHANHVIRFDGIRVDESIIDEAVKAEFDNFEAVAGALLDEFRQQALDQEASE